MKKAFLVIAALCGLGLATAAANAGPNVGAATLKCKDGFIATYSPGNLASYQKAIAVCNAGHGGLDDRVERTAKPRIDAIKKN